MEIQQKKISSYKLIIPLQSDPTQITNELKPAFCAKEMLTPSPDNSFLEAISYQSIDNKEIHDVNLPFSLSEPRSALALSHENSPEFDNLI